MTVARRPRLSAPGAPAWTIWPDLALRGAGFPADLVRTVADPALAEAADRAGSTPAARPAYDVAWSAATARLSAAVATLAADPPLREAIAWQNPPLLGRCLDRAVVGTPRDARARGRELTIVSYLQRYTLKNDTVGFFGPVGWARATGTTPALRVEPGPGVVAQRTTYFETWAIDEIAHVLAEQPAVRPWLRPRRDTAHFLADGVLHRVRRRPLPLSPAEARLAELADGTRSVRDLTALLTGSDTGFADAAELTAALNRLVGLGALHLDLRGPVEAWPERTLRQELERIGDPAASAAALSVLDEVVAARDALCAATGDPAKVLLATEDLAEVFLRHTGVPPSRRAGQTYAGRTLVYQDAVRDARVTIGAPLVAALSAPLGLVLDSARWLTGEVARRYRVVFRDRYERERARLGAVEVPLTRLLALTASDMMSGSHTLAHPVAAAVTDFQERWQAVLETPAGVRRHLVDSGRIAARVAREFPPGAPAWSAATQHSPDIMIAAASPEDVAAGRFLLVLGELHLAFNTLEGRLFVEQHDDPARLLAESELDHADRRIYAIQPKDSPFVTSRTAPPSALLSTAYTYWSWSPGTDSVVPPGPVIPGAALVVVAEGADLVVRSLDTGRTFDLLEMAGEFLSSVVVNAFRPVAPAPHRPRISIDRLVLQRESWAFPAAKATWAFVKDERERYLAARRWHGRYGLPERVFVTAPVEDKPSAVDFTSLPLVNLLAKLIRRTSEEGGGTIGLAELLPDLDQLWLTDSAHRRYTCELRMVAADPMGR